MNMNKLLILCLALGVCAGSTDLEAVQSVTRKAPVKKASTRRTPVKKAPVKINTASKKTTDVQTEVAANVNPSDTQAQAPVVPGTQDGAAQKQLLKIQMANGMKGIAAAARTTGTVDPIGPGEVGYGPVTLEQHNAKEKAESKTGTVDPIGPGEVGYGPVTLEQHNAKEKAESKESEANTTIVNPTAPVKIEDKVEEKKADKTVVQPADNGPKTLAEQLAEQAGRLKPVVETVVQPADRKKELDKKSAEAAKRGLETKIKILEEENVKLEQRVEISAKTLEDRKKNLADLESKVSSQSGDEKSASEKSIEDLKRRIKNIQEKDIDGSKLEIEEKKTSIEKLKKDLALKTQDLDKLEVTA